MHIPSLVKIRRIIRLLLGRVHSPYLIIPRGDAPILSVEDLSTAKIPIALVKVRGVTRVLLDLPRQRLLLMLILLNATSPTFVPPGLLAHLVYDEFSFRSGGEEGECAGVCEGDGVGAIKGFP